MDFKPVEAPDISGVAEAEKRKYRKVMERRGGRTWLIAIQGNSADNIYVSRLPSEEGSAMQGFGGSVISFELEDGTALDLPGPWHSNSVALLQATGVDITDKHKTFGVIGEKWEGEVLKDVLYKDEDWVIGKFNRVKLRADALARELGRKLAYYMESQGGSCRGWTTIEAGEEVEDASWVEGYLARAGLRDREEFTRAVVLIDAPCIDCGIKMRYHEIEDGKKVCVDT